MFDHVSNLQIYHCKDERSDKLWGCFRANDDVWWVFWCAFHSNASFKPHGKTLQSMVDIQKLKRQKTRKGYDPTTVSEISSIWPEFETMMLERYTWFSLQQSTDL